MATGNKYVPKSKRAINSTRSKKTASANNKKTVSSPRVSVEIDKNSSMDIRKIENGFLITESGTTGKGKNTQYYSKQYYSPTNPVDVKVSKGKFNMTGKK